MSTIRLPENIKPVWFSLVQRVQGVACRNQGLAIVSIKVLIDSEGNPIKWAEPKLTRLEPMRNADLLLDLLTGLD